MKSRMRFSSVARLVIAMMRKGFAAKRLQKMMLRIHDLERALFRRLETTRVPYDRVLLNYDDHCEFSCSSTPVKGHEKRSWDDHFHFLLCRALPCVCPTAHDDQNGSHKVMSIDDHQQQLQLQCCCVDETPKAPMDDLCSPRVDIQAEEFITAFYRQMRLQRQDSFLQYQEMLARAT